MRTWVGVVVVIGFVLSLLFGIGALSVWVHNNKCENKANVMQLPFHTSISTECMVQVNGQWVPIDNVRMVIDG